MIYNKTIKLWLPFRQSCLIWIANIVLKSLIAPSFIFVLCGLLSSCNSEKNKLFTKLKASETGIDFINKNIDTDSLNILDYLYYYNGAGVAVGDINNDGLPDIYFVSNQGSNKLYLNKGNFRFQDITVSAGVKGNADWKTGVTMADVNGDGFLDIYVCAVANHIPQGSNDKHTYFQQSHNQLFINNCNNTFSERAKEYGLDVRGYNTQAVFFDYDLDGDLDMFLLQHSVHQTDVYGDTSVRRKYSAVSGGKFFRNEGNRFTDVTLQAGIISSPLGYGLGVAVADINHDGYDDIYVSNDFHENDYYYVNQRNGTFKEMNRDAFGHESKFSMGSDIADINNDGWPDIMTLDMLPEDEHVLKSSQGDESPDLYDLKIKNGYHYQYSRNCLQLNTGKGNHFSDIALYSHVAATDWSWSPLIADYDLDGINDIFITNGIKSRLNDLDYIRFVSGIQVQKNAYMTRSYDKEILSHQPPGQWHNYIFQGDSNIVFKDLSLNWGFGNATLSQGAAYADLDNDGDLDLITNDINAQAGIYKNNARELNNRNHYLSLLFRNSSKNSFAIGTKVFVFAGKKIFYRELQSTRGFMSSSEPVLHFGFGVDTVADSLVIIWPEKRVQRLIDVKADQKLTISYDPAQTDSLVDQLKFITGILHSPTSDDVFTDISKYTGIDFQHKEDLSYVDFNRQFLIPHAISTQGPKITVADINSDGLDDFFVCGAKNQPGKIFVQTPDGKFNSLVEPSLDKDSACEDVDALFFDADNDGDPDLYVVSGGNEYTGQSEYLKDRLYINNGMGIFLKSQFLPDFYGDKSVVRCSDFDGDGDLDLFVGGRTDALNYGNIPSSYLLQNDGKGSFKIITKTVAEGLSKLGMVTDASWDDINKDGKPDLIIVGEWMPVTFFLNDGKKFVRQQTSLDKLTGWWNCIKIADVNGDGNEDILLGNFGLNSKLSASSEYPLKMYVADFDNNGTKEQLLCIEKNKQYYPFAGKEDLEKQLPYLRKKYLGYAEMAGKTSDEIFGDKLKDAKLFEASTLASMVLINQGPSGFIARQLPIAFQLAPVFSFAVDDFNKDGKADIVAGGNFYGVLPYEGRYDAMSIAVGWGNGGGLFTAPLIRSDALLTPGEVRAIGKLKIGEQNCLLVARNNDSLQVLRY
ncbi:MAG TPA: VCBS repeat-containing protein [Chitinophagaceae bacterium]|nr:VCBS repeat-containing protein [Chitinophagaceae bacterium]